MSIHRAGHQILKGTAFLSIAFVGIVYRFCDRTIFWTVLSVSAVFYGLLLYFFRMPERIQIADENLVVSPAQGRVVDIRRVVDLDGIQTPCTKISIFLSLLDVHLCVSPLAGRIVDSHHRDGRYLPAMFPKSSTLNEQQSIVIEAINGQTIVVNLIAGMIARRICCYVRAGQEIRQGDELGFIRFGSRVDIYLPLDFDIQVEVGQHVKVGKTILAGCGKSAGPLNTPS